MCCGGARKVRFMGVGRWCPLQFCPGLPIPLCSCLSYIHPGFQSLGSCSTSLFCQCLCNVKQKMRASLSSSCSLASPIFPFEHTGQTRSQAALFLGTAPASPGQRAACLCVTVSDFPCLGYALHLAFRPLLQPQQKKFEFGSLPSSNKEPARKKVMVQRASVTLKLLSLVLVLRKELRASPHQSLAAVTLWQLRRGAVPPFMAALALPFAGHQCLIIVPPE